MPAGRDEENKWLREALEFYAEEDSEFDAGGVDGGRRALEALGRPLPGAPVITHGSAVMSTTCTRANSAARPREGHR